MENLKLLTIGELKALAAAIPAGMQTDTQVYIEVDDTLVKLKDSCTRQLLVITRTQVTTHVRKFYTKLFSKSTLFK